MRPVKIYGQSWLIDIIDTITWPTGTAAHPIILDKTPPAEVTQLASTHHLADNDVIEMEFDVFLSLSSKFQPLRVALIEFGLADDIDSFFFADLVNFINQRAENS